MTFTFVAYDSRKREKFENTLTSGIYVWFHPKIIQSKQSNEVFAMVNLSTTNWDWITDFSQLKMCISFKKFRIKNLIFRNKMLSIQGFRQEIQKAKGNIFK